MKQAIIDLFDLTGKTAIVTAAGQGLGQAIAERLAEAGANVVVSARRVDTAEAVASGIRGRGGEAIAVRTEVTDLDHLEQTVAAALEAYGAIDILVNNAGGMHPFTPFLEVTPETWAETTERNLKGAYFLTQKVARTMIEAGRRGKIVNIASTAAFRPDFQLAAYNAAKAGVVSLAHSLSVELGAYGINVNTVAPGPVRTTNTEWIYDNPVFQAVLKQRVPLGGGPGQPSDVANAVLFCAAPASDRMTGATLVIDGGFMWP
jgi:NAD(P)-dependent dehydrogenase (short-subunit alcohol dehydrogenase family)